MRCVGILVLATTLLAAPARAEPDLSATAERYNNQGKKLFSKGELEGAARKFRAAIAIDPQARYFFNLCFVLNARYQLDAALGACGEVAEAKGADERLKQRAADLMAVIRKKQAAAREHDEHGGSGHQGDTGGEEDGEGQGAGGHSGDAGHPANTDDSKGDGGDRVADHSEDGGDPGDAGELTSKPLAYPVPFGRRQRVAIRTRPEPAPRAFHIGVISGVTFASQTESTFGGSTDTRTGFAFGAFLATSFSRPLAVQAEMLYMQKGASGDQGELNLDYLAVPVVGKLLLKVGRTTRFYADAGLSLSFLVRSEAKDQLGMPVDVGDQISRLDASWVVGGGVAWHRRGKSAILLDLRHERGLDDVDKLPDFEVKSRVTTLRFGYAF